MIGLPFEATNSIKGYHFKKAEFYKQARLIFPKEFIAVESNVRERSK
jgi:hypothetical protein